MGNQKLTPKLRVSWTTVWETGTKVGWPLHGKPGAGVSWATKQVGLVEALCCWAADLFAWDAGITRALASILSCPTARSSRKETREHEGAELHRALMSKGTCFSCGGSNGWSLEG